MTGKTSEPSLGTNRSQLRLLFIGLSAVIGLTCAEIGPPPGGPEDKTSPVVIGSVPENEAVAVPPGNNITIYFSERIVLPEKEKTVFLSPRPATEPDIDWDNDKLTITLADSFLVEKTYVVTLSSKLTDLRRNRLDSLLTIAFTRGETLDTGSISGIVLDKLGKPVGSVLIGLYPVEASLDYDSTYATYLATANAKGVFSFRYLSSTPFRLVAFEDKNKDELLNPERESHAVADRPIEVGGQFDLSKLRLRMQSVDTSRIAILSASRTGDGLVRVRLTRPVDGLRLATQTDGVILVDSTTGQTYQMTALLESDMKETPVLTCLFDSIPSGSYRMEVAADDEADSIAYTDIEFAVGEDKQNPTIVLFEPDSKPRFLEEVKIQITLSEPIAADAIGDSSLILWGPDSSTVSLKTEWLDPFHLSIEPDKLRRGLAYRLDIKESDFLDRAGNPLGDSVISYPINIINTDSLGWIAGKVVINSPHDREQVIFVYAREIVSQLEHSTKITDGTFRFELPAGKYLLSGYIDRNGNGQLDDGSLSPFVPAETDAVYADTVAVRARFETAGIELLFD